MESEIVVGGWSFRDSGKRPGEELEESGIKCNW